MHQRLQAPRYKAIVNKYVFANVESWVAVFEVAGLIVRDSLPED